MVAILLASGFEESEAIVPADLLRRAGVEVALVSLGELLVESSHHITVRADMTLAELDSSKVELLFLPGGLGGVDNLSKDGRVAALVRELADKGKYVTAICAAPTLLGGYGLLKGKRAVCYPGMEEGLTGAQVQKGCPVVTDGRIVTGEAAGSAVPFGLKLVETLKGPQATREVAQAIHYHGEF